MVRQLQDVCNLSDRVQLLSAQSNTVILEWHSAVKWDNVIAFVSRNLKIDKRQFALQPYRSDGDATIQSPSATLQAATTGSSAVEPFVASEAYQSPTFLQLKLLQHLRREVVAHEEPFSRDYHVPVNSKVLGEGTFGEVVMGTRKSTLEDVAIKVFRGRRAESPERAQQASLEEISAHAALGSHPEISRLLDVGVTSTSVCLVTRLHEMNLRTFYLHGELQPEVVQHVLHSMCKALQHMHHSPYKAARQQPALQFHIFVCYEI